MAFRALMLKEQDRPNGSKAVTAELAEIDDGQLPDGNVTVAVEYSTLNYKDGMILGGIGRLVRNFPHVPGIDFAGVVEPSDDARFTAGGVGSVAVHLLSAAGHQVAASTGRPQTADYLRSLGATEIIDRADLSEPPQRPLGGERFGGCVDAVGGTTLANVLTQMSYGRRVCGCARLTRAPRRLLRTRSAASPRRRGPLSTTRRGCAGAEDASCLRRRNDCVAYRGD